jgi:hypothetical protein
MKPLGFISSYKMPTARERTIPLMATMIFYFWISHVFNNMAGAVPQVLKVLLLGNFWGIIVVFIVNIFTRVSMHTSAARHSLRTFNNWFCEYDFTFVHCTCGFWFDRYFQTHIRCSSTG